MLAQRKGLMYVCDEYQGKSAGRKKKENSEHEVYLLPENVRTFQELESYCEIGSLDLLCNKS